MLVYLYNSISMPLYGLAVKNKRKLVFLASIQMAIILAFRSANVGADYGNYEMAFKYIADIPHFLDLIKRLNLVSYAELTSQFKMESGWVMLNWLVSRLGFGYRFVMIVYAFFIMVSVGYFIYKYSYKPWLSFFIFSTLGMFEFCFVSVRQNIAMAILLWAFVFMEKKSYLKVVVALIIAYSFHHTAIIFFGVIILSRIAVSKRRIGIWLVAVLIVTALETSVFNRLIYPFISRIGYESSVNMGFRLNNLFILLLAIGVFICIFSRDDFYEVGVNGWLFWGYGVTLLIETIGLSNDVVARGVYSTYIYLVCLLPNIYFYYKENPKNKMIVTSTKVQNAKFLTICTVVLLTGFLSYKLYGSSLVPYEFSIK